MHIVICSIYNEKRCKAEDVWAIEGSGYDEGVIECQIFETNRDLLLLKDLKENIISKVLY
jgi:hypothetical protein